MGLDVGTASTVAFANSNFAGAIRNIKHNNISRPAIDLSHLGTTTARTFMPGDLYDAGELQLEVLFDPGIVRPAISGASENITITFPDANSMSCYGFVTNWGYEIPLEDVIMAEVTCKFTGVFAFST